MIEGQNREVIGFSQHQEEEWSGLSVVVDFRDSDEQIACIACKVTEGGGYLLAFTPADGMFVKGNTLTETAWDELFKLNERDFVLIHFKDKETLEGVIKVLQKALEQP